MFACCAKSDRWHASIENLTKNFGKPDYVNVEENPLFCATEQVQEELNSNLTSPYNHRDELRRHHDGDNPFCVFTIAAAVVAVATPVPAFELLANAAANVTPASADVSSVAPSTETPIPEPV